MRRIPIDRFYGLPLALIGILLLAKYLEIFPVPNWLLGGALILGAVTFFLEAMKERRKTEVIDLSL